MRGRCSTLLGRVYTLLGRLYTLLGRQTACGGSFARLPGRAVTCRVQWLSLPEYSTTSRRMLSLLVGVRCMCRG
ncbi:MAG: hypothetical protein V4550_20020 [Gemmatimonadota bacterium]